MAIIEIKAPSPGESITEVAIARWLKSEGEFVEKNEEIAEIDSDKATLTIAAEETGVLHILVPEGETIAVDQLICTIDTSAEAVASKSDKVPAESESDESEKSNEEAVLGKETVEKDLKEEKETPVLKENASPLAKKIMKDNDLKISQIKGTGEGGRIMKADVLKVLSPGFGEAVGVASSKQKHRGTERVKMSTLRKKLSQRLVAVKNETALLTTFNELDMSAINRIRAQYKVKFKEVYGVNLGLMSFFTKAVALALEAYPEVNAIIDGDELIYHKYADIGIAVSAPKGLMVPVIRNAEQLSFAAIEIAIRELAEKARTNKISLDEMRGGTFTITNGGVFGSMMSTPIINPPQSAILGMHNIVDRPVAVEGKVVIRPMMYLALSYDHRIIDGRESVGFLKMVKDLLENPVKMIFGGTDPEELLLNL